MRAYVMTSYGNVPDVVRLVDVADPIPGPEEIVCDICLCKKWFSER